MRDEEWIGNEHLKAIAHRLERLINSAFQIVHRSLS
jgi:hypothetical protein